jgi:hypothetical protein
MTIRRAAAVAWVCVYPQVERYAATALRASLAAPGWISHPRTLFKLAWLDVSSLFSAWRRKASVAGAWIEEATLAIWPINSVEQGVDDVG